MSLDKSVDNILNMGSKAKIIRLFVSRENTFRASGRKVANLIKVSAPAAHAALKALYKRDVLKREIIGKQHIYSLNSNNKNVREILKPMFQKESFLKQEIEDYIIKPARNKYIYIIAGSNGSGKTTFAKEFLPDYAQCKHFLNSDMIAQGLSPFSPRVAAMKAGRLVIERMDDLAKKGLDFGFETTLAGKTYINRLNYLKKNGYSLHLFFLWIPSVELALARIKDRVDDGGHNVPAQDVKRRFFRGIHNLFKYYRPLVDSWILLNNASTIPEPIAKKKENKLIVVDENLFTNISKTMEKK